MSLLIVGAVLAAQLPAAVSLLDADTIFEAGHAKTILAVNAILAAVTVSIAAFVPPRLRALALVPGAVVAAGMLVGAVTLGGHLWDLTAAVLTLTSAWWIGRTVLSALRAPRLQGVAVVELVIGLGVVGLVVFALGRLDLLAWWSVGVLLVLAGGTGAVVGGIELWSRRDGIWTAVAGSRIGAACAGLLLLQLGWAIVWLSAPEIMYDALYAKEFLPQFWADTGSIDPLLIHPVLNVTGLMQIDAVPGHTVAAADVGRQLQMLSWLVLTATVWWWGGSRSAIGPLAALAVGVVPQLVWQSTTAYDDLMLAVGAVALGIALFRTIDLRRSEDPGFRTALAIGLLVGACVWLKLNLLAVSGVLAIGWILVAGPLNAIVRRTVGVGIGTLAVAGPAFALRWIDTGNPVFPSYNQIFKSADYPPINEQFNFPFWPDAGSWAALKAPFEAVAHPWLMNEATPQGAFGLLVAATVLGVLIGWRGGNRRAAVIVWAGVVVSLVLWWSQFRYLRYAVPLAALAVILLLTQVRDWRPGRLVSGGLLVAAGCASALYLPSTVASFWNVPHRDLPFAAAFGRWSSDDYLRNVFPEKDALDAFQRIAPRGALALSDAHERAFLDQHDLAPIWEVDRLLQLSGPSPTAPDDTLQRLSKLGIRWALVTGANRTSQGLGWLPGLLAEHGEPVFSDRGWDLYQLVDSPQRPQPIESCDSELRGRAGCWTGTLDAKPGLGDGESPGGITRSVPVCPGKTLVVTLTTAAGGDPAQVSINSDARSPLSGHVAGIVPPGETGSVSATAPAGTRQMAVMIAAGANGGAVSHADLGLLGRCQPQ